MRSPAAAAEDLARRRRVESGRWSITLGPILVATFGGSVDLAEVLAEVSRWGDPAAYQALPWYTVRALKAYRWARGEQLAVWRAGRLRAVATRRARGVVVAEL